MKPLVLALSLAALAIPPLPALGAPGGELDASFGQNGRLILSQHRQAAAIVQQPGDGKLVLAGGTVNDAGHIEFAVFRLNTDGSLDESFGDHGVVTISFGGEIGSASALALQADGKIIAAGYATEFGSNDSRLAVARLNPDGTLDVSFDADGRVTLDLQGNVLDVALSPTAEIQIGARYRNTVVLVRLTADGSPDISFGEDPIPGALLVDHGDSIGYLVALARQNDGKYVVCGADAFDDWYGTGVGNMTAIRINPDGSLDTGFGSDGVWKLEEDVTIDSYANACVVAPDGSIVVAGARDYVPVLVKMRADGVTDTSLWPSGVTTIPLVNSSAPDRLVMLANGNLLIGGSSGGKNVYVAHIDFLTGLLDPDFGNGGMSMVDFGENDQDANVWLQGLVQQSDSKIVVVARVYSSGVTFDNAGEVDYFDQCCALALARIDPDGAGNNGFVGFANALHFVTEGLDPEVTIAVQRTGGSAGSFLVDYETRNGTAATSDYGAASGTLVWPDGDMEQKFISVLIIQDTVNEGTEHFQVALSSSKGALARSGTTVVVYNRTPLTRPTNAALGGGGAFGIELLLLLICCLPIRKLSA